MSFEGSLIHSLQMMLRSPIGIFFSILCARWLIFLEVAWVLVLGITMHDSKGRHAVKEAFIAMLIALYGALTVSQLIGRPRPFMVEASVLSLVPVPLSMNALPSAHASAAFALALTLAWTKPKAALVPLFLAVAIGFGRVAVGVHYPTDVLAGVLMGCIAAFIVRLLHAALRRTTLYREQTHG